MHSSPDNGSRKAATLSCGCQSLAAAKKNSESRCENPGVIGTGQISHEVAGAQQAHVHPQHRPLLNAGGVHRREHDTAQEQSRTAEAGQPEQAWPAVVPWCGRWHDHLFTSPAGNVGQEAQDRL